MSASSHTVREDPSRQRIAVACPTCEYWLRGLRGPVVTCPECGTSCDIEELARQYRRTWSTTPLYERMMRVAMFSLLTVLLAPTLVLGFLFGLNDVMSAGFLVPATIFIAVVVWGAMAAFAVRGLSPFRGAMLLALLHVVMSGYLVCGVGVFVGLIGLVTLVVAIVSDPADYVAILWCAAFVLVGFGSALLIPLLWKLDQRIGAACLRHSLYESDSRRDRMRDESHNR